MTEFFFELVIVLIKLDLSLSGFLEYLGSIGSLQCIDLLLYTQLNDNVENNHFKQQYYQKEKLNEIFCILFLFGFCKNIIKLMKGQEAYLSSIRSALEISLCLRDFPSILFQKDNKPYIELTGYNPKIDPLVGKPIYLARNKKQQFLIEPSINSCRISFTLKRSDEIDSLIAGKFAAMAASRAEAFQVMRRKPIPGYDITLLITNQVLQKYNSSFIIELILNLVGSLQKDLLEIKLNINTQCRIAATYFMDQLANPQNEEFW